MALSKTHIFELLDNHPDTVSKRFEFIQQMLPIRYESMNFFKKEILLALFKNGFVSISEADKEIDLSIFSTVIHNKEDLSLIKAAHQSVKTMGFYRAMKKANKLSWRAKSSGGMHVKPTPRLKDAKTSFMFRLFAWFIDMDPRNRYEMKNTFENTLNRFKFKTELKSTLKSQFGAIEKSIISLICEKTTIQNCKGLWLRQETEAALKKASDFEANNEYDLEHVQYFPYVSMFLTDKRIADKIIQVLRRSDALEELKGNIYPFKTANSIESIEDILFNSNNLKNA